MTTINFIGLIVCLIGISIHVVMKAIHSNGKQHFDRGYFLSITNFKA